MNIIAIKRRKKKVSAISKSLHILLLSPLSHKPTGNSHTHTHDVDTVFVISLRKKNSHLFISQHLCKTKLDRKVTMPTIGVKLDVRLV